MERNWSLLELKAFCLVVDLQNLTLAAQRLGITQQALSMMVRRWREALADPVYTRTRYGVLPTELSRALRERLERPLLEVGQALREVREFDPSQTTRTFRLHMSDVGQLVFLPSFARAMAQQASQARLVIEQIPWEDVPAALATGGVDLAIGSLPMLKGREHRRSLRRERYVVVMCQKHPLARSRLTLVDYAQATHFAIDAPSSGHRLIESMLLAEGVIRRIGLTVSHYLAAEQVLSGSDYLLTLPEVAVQAFHDPTAFVIQPVPVGLASFDVNLYWHERASSDPAVQWLKEELIRCASTRRGKADASVWQAFS